MPSFKSRILKFLIHLTAKKSKVEDPISMRAQFEKDFPTFSKARKDMVHEAVSIRGRPAEWVGSGTLERRTVLLYLHGGAYVFGSSRSFRNAASHFAHASGSKVLLPNYRLAPEHPFPAAFDDTVNAYLWLLENQVPARSITLLGDSAGAGLALALMMTLRERGLPMPSSAAFISPWVDLTGAGETLVTNAKTDPMCSKEKLEAWGRMYMTAKNEPKNPKISPLHGDLRGLPPLLTYVSGDEVLLSDATRLHEKAQAAGVQSTLRVVPGMVHVWPLLGEMLTESRDAIREIGEHLRARSADSARKAA